jgi:uncharacterized protein (DUF2336 family)
LDILRRLLNDFELAVRRKSSTKPSKFHGVPSDLAMALVNHEIEVGYPTLTRNCALEYEQLIEVAQTLVREHQIAAALWEGTLARVFGFSVHWLRPKTKMV